MNEAELRWLIVPKNTAHVVGTKVPKDIHYRVNSKLIGEYELTAPDGLVLMIPIYRGEIVKNKIQSYIDSWYRVTRNRLEYYSHFIIKDKCPVCGGELRAKIANNQCLIWCINHPDCDYKTAEEGLKARERIFEKHGFKKTIITHKTGSRVICSNKPIKK